MGHRGSGRVVAACVGALALSACGGGGTSEDTATVTHVDRMAEREKVQAYLERKADCLTELGWPAEMAPEEAIGGILVPMKVEHGGDHEGMRAAEAQCDERLGGSPTFAPVSEAEIGKLYDMELEAYECLVEQGYAPREPSTREEYIAKFDSGTNWRAHQQQLPETPDFSDAVCPQPMPEFIEW